MGEDRTRGHDAATERETTAPSGWVTTQQAARALNIPPRTVHWNIEQGNLEARPEGEGAKRTWLVSIDSLQAFRDTRQGATESPGDYRAPVEDADVAAQSSGDAVRELADRLAEERRRREEAERERDVLRRQLEGVEGGQPEDAETTAQELHQRLEEARESPERADEGLTTARPASGGVQEAREQRSWWRRVFGG